MPDSSLLTFNDIRRGALCRYIEKQLDLPAAAIKLGDRERRQREVVGEKHQRLAFIGFEPNAPQRFRVACLGVEHGERNGLQIRPVERSSACE